MQELNYKNWKNDIKNKLESLKIKIDKNEISKSLYGGFYVWDSKFIENPEIMFIGINPGNGNPNNSGKIVTEPEQQISYMEFLDGENDNYTLAKETIKSFEMAGFSIPEIRELLNEKSIKTNFYYLITKNQNDISKCINQISDYDFKDFWKQSYEWTGQLIELTKPKVIICEGKSVFDIIKDYDDILESDWKNDCGYLKRPNGQIIIGYNRIFSNIKNKEELSELIKRYVK
jgi:DNA-binding transcriptional MerR regulator